MFGLGKPTRSRIMRKLKSLFESRVTETATAIPSGRIDRLRQSFKRRLSDAVEDVFHRALIENDLRTAAGLYAILEDIHVRRVQSYGSAERRISDEILIKARAELDRCREMNHRETVPAA
jgi:hypothetical protein